jgi:hypothetical protein
MPRVLSIAPGMHRWVWDLHYSKPFSTRYDYPIAAVPHDTPLLPQGPNALPGQYTVRLTVNGNASTQPLSIKMDPRVKTSPEGLTQLFQLESRLAAMMTESSEAVVQAHSAQEQLQKLAGQASGPLAEAISALDKKIGALVGAGGGFFAPPSPNPTLARSTGEASTLYGALARGDYAPTAAQSSAAKAAVESFEPLHKKWQEVKATDIPALNQQLQAAHLPEIHLASPVPEPADDSDDID